MPKRARIPETMHFYKKTRRIQYQDTESMQNTESVQMPETVKNATKREFAANHEFVRNGRRVKAL